MGGAQGTYWTTSLTVLNLAGFPRTVEAFYTPRGSDGTTDFLAADLELGANSSTTWEDVVETVFGTTGAGSLEIHGADIIVSSRTATPGLEGARTARASRRWRRTTSCAPAARRCSGRAASSAHRPTARTSACARCGGGRRGPGDAVESAGPDRRDQDHRPAPYGNTQINDLPHALGGLDQMEDGAVEVEILDGGGRVGAYLSIVDNVTGDPTYLAVGFSPPSTVE